VGQPFLEKFSPRPFQKSWKVGGINVNYIIQGDKGDTGQQGIQGIQGEKGADGTDGITYDWLTGTSVPTSAIGKQGDMYLNTSTQDVYKKATSSSWSLLCNIKGLKGDTGQQGEKGQQGDKGEQGIQGVQGNIGADGTNGITYDWLTGTAVPNSATGKQGDMYLNTYMQKIYKKTTSSSWSLLCNIKGLKGDKGDTGEQGIQGEKGDKGDNGQQGTQGIQGNRGADGTDGVSYDW